MLFHESTLYASGASWYNANRCDASLCITSSRFEQCVALFPGTSASLCICHGATAWVHLSLPGLVGVRVRAKHVGRPAFVTST